MTCIKTGAWVYISPYMQLARCDVYEIGDCFIFRWIGEAEQLRDNSKPLPEGAWLVVAQAEQTSWYRDDLGVVVVHKSRVNPGERCNAP